MANPEHLAKLKEGVEAWTKWRKQNPEIRRVDLREADLHWSDLCWADLSKSNLGRADLSWADISRANLYDANLSGANLGGANLYQTNLGTANLGGANLSMADLRGANLGRTDLSKANLSRADLSEAELRRANLSEAYLDGANLFGANLSEANISGAHLTSADLTKATLVSTNLERANLTACRVFGISAWDVRLDGTIQSNLVITPYYESPIQVDNLEVAQFIYLLLNNAKIRSVIDTITSKVVLILGRFTPGRKVVLDAIRDELRKRDYLPVLFDFEKPASKDLTGTIFTLANMARFIIADLTDPSSVPYELGRLVPNTKVPVQTIILEGQREYAMFPDLKTRYHWVLEPHQYKSQELLIAELGETVIAPAEAKAKELAGK